MTNVTSPGHCESTGLNKKQSLEDHLECYCCGQPVYCTFCHAEILLYSENRNYCAKVQLLAADQKSQIYQSVFRETEILVSNDNYMFHT